MSVGTKEGRSNGMNLFCIDNDPTHPDACYEADATMLVVTGEVDYGATPYLRARINCAMKSGTRHLVLDLSGVTFIDSSAIGVLIGAATTLRESARGSLAIVCTAENERVLRIFDIVGFASLIALYHTRDDCRTALYLASSMHLCGPAERAAPASRLEPSAQTSKATATGRYAEVAAVTETSGHDPAVQAGGERALDEFA
jgi:anti-sigma B factor antagonist